MIKVFVADKLAKEGIAALQQYPALTIDFTPLKPYFHGTMSRSGAPF